MTALDTAIDELLALEPFWKICYPCKFKGFCCHGAVIELSADEQRAVDECVSRLPSDKREQFEANRRAGRRCVYQTDTECLIHSVRPQNCRYTPFQALITAKDVLRYTMVRVGASGHCEFRRQDIRVGERLHILLESHKFLRLDSFGRQTYYLNLNWLALRGQL